MAEAAVFSVAINNVSKAYSAFVSAVTAAATNPMKMKEIYTTLFLDGDPLFTVLVLNTLLVIFAYVHSVYSGLTFVVDRAWSIVPAIYLGTYALFSSYEPNGIPFRLAMHTDLVLLWAMRLTYNFYRKGGYSGNEEDYRWGIIRRWKIMQNVAVKQAFNLVFVAFYQCSLLVAITCPAYLSYLVGHGTGEASQIDYVAAGLALIFLAGETIADQQQWYFHQKKKSHRSAFMALADVKQGFLSTGLFRFSRHPNFFCEFMFWFSMYLFSVGATGVWINWTLMGPVLLTLLMVGSTKFTESISMAKYPSYVNYVKSTSMLVPWMPGRSIESKMN